VIQDVAKRPFIALGFVAFLLLVPVAATSGKDAPRRLGGKRWRRIHALVYPAVLLAGTHFLLRVKADVTEPLVFIGLIALLLGVRVVSRIKKSVVRSRA
jgi:methionine sulfoxide reductase heme-binding subunit